MRMSATYIAEEIGTSKEAVLKCLETKGLIVYELGSWSLTDLGKERGGRPSRDYGVPTFGEDIIEELRSEIGYTPITCQGCGCDMRGQGIYPQDVKTWKCLKCGYENKLD